MFVKHVKNHFNILPIPKLLQKNITGRRLFSLELNHSIKILYIKDLNDFYFDSIILSFGLVKQKQYRTIKILKFYRII
jgi:hypothetical protein